MSFGAVFLPQESRPKANLHKLHREIVEQEIRASIKPPNKDLDRVAQQISRRFSTGASDPRVLQVVRARQKQFDDEINGPAAAASSSWSALFDHRKPLSIGAPPPYISPDKNSTLGTASGKVSESASSAAAINVNRCSSKKRHHALDPTTLIRHQQRQPDGKYAADTLEPYESRFQVSLAL